MPFAKFRLEKFKPSKNFVFALVMLRVFFNFSGQNFSRTPNRILFKKVAGFVIWEKQNKYFFIHLNQMKYSQKFSLKFGTLFLGPFKFKYVPTGIHGKKVPRIACCLEGDIPHRWISMSVERGQPLWIQFWQRFREGFALLE